MAGASDPAGFFEQEWARFWAGWDKLSPEQQAAEELKRVKARARAGQQNTVSLPGWDSVVHITPRLVPTAAQRDEYYRARRERRAPNLPADVINAIEARRASAQRIATSAAPPYAQAWGQMLTALDNVQDFTTTVATLGRLALWPSIRALDAALPRFAAEGWARSVFGATPQAAERIAQLAAREAATAAYLEARAASLAEYALAARAGLERSSLLAAGREAAELAAGAAARAAYRSALTRAGAGIGSRLLGRLIPGLGWILLAADLINLLSYLGIAGMAGYGVACFGPGKGLAGLAAPLIMRGTGLLGPCGIREKVTAIGELNPFSMTRTAARQARLARATPSLGNLLEVLQTTDQFWGVGLSFGAIVGAFTEGAYAAELQARGERASLQQGPTGLGTAGVITGVVALQTRSKALGAIAAGSLLADVVGRTATAPLRKKVDAAKILQNAPPINGTQETFTEYEHLEALVNYAHALDLIATDLHGLPWQDYLAERLPASLAPPEYWDPLTLEIIRETDPELTSVGRWPLEGAPRVIDSTELVHWGGTHCARAMRDFLEPRRDTAVGMFAGGLYNMLTEKIWAMLEPGPRFLTPRWTPDYKALLALGETARLVNLNTPDANLWAWWQDMRELADKNALGELDPDTLDSVAARHQIELIRVEEPFVRQALH